MSKIYRLTLDENGQEDCTDFSDVIDARNAFLKAARRKTVFTASVDAYDAQTFDCLGRVFHCDNSDSDLSWWEACGCEPSGERGI